jgi:hypothetical protein
MSFSFIVVNCILRKLFKTSKWDPMLDNYMVLGGSHLFLELLILVIVGVNEN